MGLGRVRIAAAIASGLGGLANAPLAWLKGKLGIGGAPPPARTPLAGARALGGPVKGGLPYLVGERGPELFVPAKSGVIETNGMLKGLAAGGRAGALAIGIDSSSLVEAGRDAKKAGDLLRDGLDRAVPIVLTGSIDEATRRATKLTLLLAAIQKSEIALDARNGGFGLGGDGSTPSAGGASGRGGSSGSIASGSSFGSTPSVAMSALAKAGITDRPVETGVDAFNIYGPKKRGDGIRPIDPSAFSGSMDGKPAGCDAAPVVGGPGFNTRGVRNMNPGNIGFGKWAAAHGATGAAGTDTGHGVAVFPSFAAGYKAMHDLALSKYQNGARSLDQLIAGEHGWTPGNHTAAVNVARAMGIGPNDDAHLDDAKMMEKFRRGLSAQELGPNGAKYALAKAAQEGSAGAFKTASPFGVGGFNVPSLAPSPTPVAPAAGQTPGRGNDRGQGTPLEVAAAQAGKGASYPGHISGKLAIDGDSFKFGSGGVHGSSSIPFGDYPIALNAPGAWGKFQGAMGLNNNQIWDKALGRMRQGILMHVGHSANLITEGLGRHLDERRAKGPEPPLRRGPRRADHAEPGAGRVGEERRQAGASESVVPRWRAPLAYRRWRQSEVDQTTGGGHLYVDGPPDGVRAERIIE